jgi:branched-chain amino acid transport system ATP-binding protein
VSTLIKEVGNIVSLLSVKDIRLSFGGITALDGVSFELKEGQILGLIGPNGAGKTTMFNCISRLYTPNSGEITFNGEAILGKQPHEMAGLGMGRTFQNVALFPRLSVLNNVMIGGHSVSTGNMFSDAWGGLMTRLKDYRLEAKARQLLAHLKLNDVTDSIVSNLPFGTQKRVELARALMSDPKLLLLDEPAGGLNHDEVYQLGDQFKNIRDQFGTTLLLVEHHMGLVMSVADHVVALNFGRKLAEGSPSQIQKDPEVIRAYLGGDAA